MDGSGEALIELYDIPGDCDYDLELYNNSRTRIARSTNGGNDDEYISTTLDEGWYYILVEPYDNTYSSNSYYALRLMITLDEVEPPDIPSDAFGFHVVDEYGDPIEDAAIYVYAQKNDDMLVNNDSDMPIPEPVYTDENGYAVITEVGTVNPSTYAVTYHDISSEYEYGINVTSPDVNSPTYAQYSFPDAEYPSTIAKPRINAPNQGYETKPNNQPRRYAKKPGQLQQTTHRQHESFHGVKSLSSSTITSQSDSNPGCMATETKPSHRKPPEPPVLHWRDGSAYCP